MTTALLLLPSSSVDFDLFATHEVTVQFATQDGKPLANAEVQVFPPGDAKNPVITGRTDAEGKFVFEADQDGFWSAEAKDADQVARVMIRVGGEFRSSRRAGFPRFSSLACSLFCWLSRFGTGCYAPVTAGRVPEGPVQNPLRICNKLPLISSPAQVFRPGRLA